MPVSTVSMRSPQAQQARRMKWMAAASVTLLVLAQRATAVRTNPARGAVDAGRPLRLQLAARGSPFPPGRRYTAAGFWQAGPMLLVPGGN